MLHSSSDLWSAYIKERLSDSTVYPHASLLGAHLFKSTRPYSDVFAIWNKDPYKSRNYFAKLSPEKQYEIARHAVVEIPLYSGACSIRDALSYFGMTDSAPYVLGYVPSIRQRFPTYKDIPEHVEHCENFFTALLHNAFALNFPSHVFIVGDKCYTTVAGLSVIFDSVHDAWSHIHNTAIEALPIIDMHSDAATVHAISFAGNEWITFATNARRSMLKDFDLYPYSICSNIGSFNKRVLNRRENDEAPTHLITIFDVRRMHDVMCESMCEPGTLSMLQNIIDTLCI